MFRGIYINYNLINHECFLHTRVHTYSMMKWWKQLSQIESWNQMFIENGWQKIISSFRAAQRICLKNLWTCDHSDIMANTDQYRMWGLCSSTYPIVYPTSYTPLSSECCSTLMHALFRRCVSIHYSCHDQWMSTDRDLYLSTHVAMAESENGR